MNVSKLMRVTWPVVALVLIVVVAFVALFALIPADQPELRTALVTVVTSLSAGVVGVFTHQSLQRLSGKLDDRERERRDREGE